MKALQAGRVKGFADALEHELERRGIDMASKLIPTTPVERGEISEDTLRVNTTPIYDCRSHQRLTRGDFSSWWRHGTGT